MANAEEVGPAFKGENWNPPLDAIESSVSGNGVDQPIVRVLSHPGAPYFQTATDTNQSTLIGVANNYIAAVTGLDIDPKFEIEPGWFEELEGRSNNAFPQFGWMERRERNATMMQAPLGSLDVSTDGDNLIVLFAGECLGPDFFLGSEFGLRVGLRWRTIEGRHHFSIIGITAVLPFGRYKTHPYRIQSSEGFVLSRDFLLSQESKTRMAELSNLEEKSISVRGFRLARLDEPDKVQIERHGVGFRIGLDGNRIPYAVSTVSIFDTNQSVSVDSLLNRSEFFADAYGDGNASVFEHVPVPQRRDRPRRDEKALNGCRHPGSAIDTGTQKPPLKYKDNLQVIPCPRFVKADVGATSPIVVSLLENEPPGVRSNAASAVQGFWFARDFLRRMEAYGLDPTDYFQLINKRFDIAYRSGVSPGPGKDGRSVNARVQPVGWPADFIGPVDPNHLPVVQVHLSIADSARRARAPWKPGDKPTPAVPMGIAADERWLWHEFGHILTLASTGELELRFAHSPGDALAAIVGDPELESKVAKSQWRGATFPWVYLPRRHDRCVLGGWSWCGSMHKALAQVPASAHPRRKGYLSEQILSSTLFRLYRCIGGDTVDQVGDLDREARRRASHYTCFLIMKALHILGDAKVHPAMKAHQLQHALKEADLHQVEWSATYPQGSQTSYKRVGGCSTKVIRWAFEAQGLHAPSGHNHDYNAIGEPKPVDVYIRSLRPTMDPGLQSAVDFGPGSYVPTSLHWQAHATDAPPGWQADRVQGIVWRAGDGEIDVWVGNRGAKEATDVTVLVWAAEWPVTLVEPPDWQNDAPLVWVSCPTAPDAPKPVASRGSVKFGPFKFVPVAGMRYVVVAMANCPGDRALITRFNHACSSMPTRLVDLVPNDNNMGLIVV